MTPKEMTDANPKEETSKDNGAVAEPEPEIPGTETGPAEPNALDASGDVNPQADDAFPKQHDDASPQDGELKWEAYKAGSGIAARMALISGLCLEWLKRIYRIATNKKPLYKNPWFWWSAVIILISLFILILIPALIQEPEDPYLNLSIHAYAHGGFNETSEIIITGIDRLTAEELQEAISIIPKTGFTVLIAQDDPHAVLTLENVRNIEYTLTFRMDIETPPNEPGHSSPPIEHYTYTTTLNGPQLMVTAQNLSDASRSLYSPITLSFSEQVDIGSLEKNLRIEPRTRFTIEYNHYDVTIRPDTGWNPSRAYTVIIGADYTSLNGKQLIDNRVFSFSTPSDAAVASPPQPWVEFTSDRSYILSESRDMTLIFHAGSLKDKVPVIIETYKMPALEKYREQGHIYLDYDVTLNHLEKMETNAYLIENGENRFNLVHPGLGSYIIAASYKHPRTGDQIEERASYLITNYSVYMQSSARDTLIWLNKSDGSVGAGYSVFVGDNDEFAGITSTDGTLIGDISGNNKADFSIYDSNGNLVYYDNGVAQHGHHSERYYSYLFTDRTLYKPEDTVSFWGFVQPFRNNRMEMPGTVTVTFDQGGLDIVQEIPVSETGAFSGEIKLERIRSSQYNLNASLYLPALEEGEAGTEYTLDSLYLSVKEYTKPSYVLSSVVHEDFYGPKDEVTITATASFYDGTPLPHFPVELSYRKDHSWASLGTQNTDSYGNITFTFPAWEGSRENPSPISNSYMVRIASDGEHITHMGGYTVFPSDVLVEAELVRQPNGSNLTLAIRTYELNLNSQALRDAMASRGTVSNSSLLQIARGRPVDVEDMTVSLRWDFYDTRSIRHRYIFSDYYGNRILFSNNYSLDYIVDNNPKAQIIEDPQTFEKIIKVSTENGTVAISDLIYLGENTVIDFRRDAYCQAHIRFNDNNGNSRGAYAYYPGYNSYREDWGEDNYGQEPEITHGYSFEVTNLSNGSDITPSSYYGHRSLNMNVGDTARFTLMLDSMPVATNGKILYSLVQDGIMESGVINGDSLEFTYKMEYGMSFQLVAVYFDGIGTRAVKQIWIFANTESMDLNIDVTSDRASYRPGDRVTLSVKATDQRGRGVPGNLCVAVVDESIFALSEQHVSVLYDLYSSVRYLDNSVTQYFTTYRDEVPENYPMDGGKDGGDNIEFYDSYRSNFKDTALFFPTTTNSAGNAAITFDLPDNTTSWRITAVQVGSNLTAGQSKSNIISALPFFCKPVLTSKYIEGDDFAMLVQGHGALLDSESEISYTVTVTGDSLTMTQTAEGKAYEPKEVNFSKLPIGSYTVVTRAQYSGYSDTVELPINIIKSNLELVVNKPLDLSKPLDIEAVRYPVTITFYDREAQPFITSINSLFGHYCMQTSQRLSRVVAKQAIRYSMPVQQIPHYISDTSENISDMQNLDGGIGPHIDSASEPLLTTYVLLVAKDQFNLRRMADYYNAQLKLLTDPKEIAACYLGLAVIGETDSEALLKGFNENDRLDVKAYYIAALYSIGQAEIAAELYEKHCAPYVAKRTPNSLEWERDAAACWIAASLMRHPSADELSMYFGSYNWRFRTLYECMIYVNNYEKIVVPSSFSYSLNGQTHDVYLGADLADSYGHRSMSGLMHTVALSKSGLESFRLLDYSENLSAAAYYIGEPSEIGIQPSENMSIEQSIKSVDENTYEIRLEIRLAKDAPTGQYDISGWIPSNSRMYDFDKNYKIANNDQIGFSVRQENQNLYVSFNNRNQSGKTIFFTYRIRKTFDSEAVLDTAYMIHGDTGENCNSVKSIFRP